MAITIVTSIQDDFGYYNNLAFLQRGLQEGGIQFRDGVNNYAPDAMVFNDKGRLYDFTRSAQSDIREDMTANLSGVLPGLEMADLGKIRGAFDCLFNYYSYKGFLDQVGQQRAESMKMLIFNEAQEYVAHVYFNATSRKTGPRQFTVTAALTCQRYMHFLLQDTDFEAVLQALQNMHAWSSISRRSRWMKTENVLNYCLVVSFLYVFYFCCALSTVLFIQCTQARIRTITF